MIQEIYNISSLRYLIKNSEIETLLIFDVDRVLIIPEDKIFWPCNKEIEEKFSKLYFDSLPKDRQEKLQSIIMNEIKFRVLDQDFSNVFSELLPPKLKMIALTACDTGEKGIIKNLENWRCNQLTKLQFNFTQSFSDSEKIVLDKLPRREYPYAIFQNGILFTGNYTKGETLSAFLDAVNYHPQCILFIDDLLENIESVYQEAKKRNIIFKGFHYKKAYALNEILDERIAEIQYRYLVEHEQ